jgi:Fe-S-cluster-containing dehydrogenase component
MEMNRRDLLKKLTTGTAAAAAGSAVSVATLGGIAHAEEGQVPPQAVGLLYDATRCIGCQTCVVACTKANNLVPDTRRDPLHQSPTDLNNRTKTIIKLYKPTAAGESFSYVKQQCMHCVDPACVAACMFGGLKKDAKSGVVTWTGKYCVGCRYCEIACPYHVPKFRWEGFNPEIVKCEFCKDRLAKGQEPACTAVCPRKAVIFGPRQQLLDEAKSRIAANPGKYFQDRVFGEKEGGGTQVLYLSHVAFDKIGLPNLGEESIPHKFLKWQKRLYSYLVVPAGLYAVLVGSISKNFKEHEAEAEHEEETTGLRPQI